MDNNVYTAEQFLKDWFRVCDSCNNKNCYRCRFTRREEPKKLINEVHDWALSHPLKTFKIRHEELSVGYFDVEACDSNEAIEKFKEKYKEEGLDLSQMEVIRSYDSAFEYGDVYDWV